MRELDKRQQFDPILARQITVHGKHVVDGAVDTLENRVLSRTVRGGAGFLVPEDRLQFSHELVFKFLLLI